MTAGIERWGLASLCDHGIPVAVPGELTGTDGQVQRERSVALLSAVGDDLTVPGASVLGSRTKNCNRGTG